MLDHELPTEAEIAAELPAVAGRDIIHVMTQQEIAEFVAVEQAEAEMEDAQELLLSDMAEAARANWLAAAHGEMQGNGVVHDADELSEYLKRKTKHEYLRAAFWYKIRMGKNSFNSRLAVAQGWNIVSGGPKYATR